MNNLSPTQKAWLAGFIDGEGFIGITFQRKKENSQQSASPQYHAYLIITNNDKNSIYYVQSLIGDGRTYQLSGATRFHSPATFQYKLSKREALFALLNELKPYLVVKRRQCQLLLDYIKLRKTRKIITGGGSRGKTSFSVEEETIYRKLLALNRRFKRRTNEFATS